MLNGLTPERGVNYLQDLHQNIACDEKYPDNLNEICSLHYYAKISYLSFTDLVNRSPPKEGTQVRIVANFITSYLNNRRELGDK